MSDRASATNQPPAAGAQSPWVQLRSASNHPFVYRKMVRQADPQARVGDVVNVYDKAGEYFGRGLFNPRSQIVVRMLTHADEAVDDAFWSGRLARAVALRDRLGLAEQTDAYRLVHAEGDDLSGLIVERFADCLVFEVFSVGMFQRYEQLAGLLAAQLGRPGCLERPDQEFTQWRCALRADSRIERLEGFKVPSRLRLLRMIGNGDGPADEAGEQQTQVRIREHGLRYRVDVRHGHKTGFFCDQRENRRRVAEWCRERDVLDLCCYTGGFSLCALKLGRARSVSGVDLDEDAIAVAKENANLNQARVDFVHADAFTYMRQMLANGRQFDVVVLDPPKLATYREEHDDALRKYHDLNHLAVQLVRSGGVLLTCSCSGLVNRPRFNEVVFRAARQAGRRLQVFDETGAAADHPVMMQCPESAYLKAMWARVV